MSLRLCPQQCLSGFEFEADGAPHRRCLGIEAKKGTLRPGADADLVVLDRKGKVLGTWVRGHEVWKSASS